MKETLLRAESAYGNKKINENGNQQVVCMISTRPEMVHVDSSSVTSNNVILSKMIVVIEKTRIREIHNISNCYFGTFTALHTQNKQLDAHFPGLFRKCLRASQQRHECV